jgi:hypothetical protein
MALANVPAAHTKHCAEFDAPVYSPAAHGTQAAWPTDELVK